MGRILLAFHCFFGILFHGQLSEETTTSLGLSRRVPPRETAPAAPPPPPKVDVSAGALQLLGILQRDARLVDFLMEDISAYDDEQVGAAVRSLHDQCREALDHYVKLAPVIDGVEGSFTNLQSAGPQLQLTDGSTVKFLGNVPARGVPAGGVLRHKGWRAEKVQMPPVTGRENMSIIAPAEIEVE